MNVAGEMPADTLYTPHACTYADWDHGGHRGHGHGGISRFSAHQEPPCPGMETWEWGNRGLEAWGHECMKASIKRTGNSYYHMYLCHGTITNPAGL